MGRTDRLFDIIQVLRSASGPISATSIAEILEVSPRTIYRDMATLKAMRIPIEGEVGVGYVMGRGYDLPPLNLDAEELESIVVGVNLLAGTGDKALQRAAERVLSKIQLNRTPYDPLWVSERGIDAPPQVSLDLFRHAIRREQKIRIQYQNADSVQSNRTILPLALT
ncbi:MAG: HTH domain-containing protein [Alphaproteobacteria bacterium]